jgi:hypothetical protein
MNITESFNVDVQEATPADGRWLRVDASPTELVINASGRNCACDVTGLRKLRAIVDHLIEAPEATQASTLAAIAAEFEE